MILCVLSSVQFMAGLHQPFLLLNQLIDIINSDAYSGRLAVHIQPFFILVILCSIS
jgi:hypothetical protein